MKKRVVIVGGGTAGWLAAGYLAKRLSADLPGGASITLIESETIGILGVGEGTFPTIRKTLATIGLDEAELVRRCQASFKQGAKFANWAVGAGESCVHAFQEVDTRSGLDLLPYWLLGEAGTGSWDEVSTAQTVAGKAHRAPKLPSHPDFTGPLNYAFHFDAILLAGLLKEKSIANGVTHLIGTVEEVLLDEQGAIAGIRSAEHGVIEGDLYIDCTGFRAELIGKAMGVPWRSCRDGLFCNRAVAAQVPYPAPDSPIASYTISTAQEAGWVWDIGLTERRGVGYVYSSDHTDDARAETILREYLGKQNGALDLRKLRFEGGYREINWYKNCVAIGLSSGFFEPLEATGIVFAEIAAMLVANLFPWGGDYETSARQFNRNMKMRYERTLDFIKLHYFITQRRDTPFWRDNVAPETARESLHELLDRWRFRPPNELDIDENVDIFPASSWQYVLYGLGWKTDLSAKAGSYRYRSDARAAFAEVRRQGEFALANLPTNRQLVTYAAQHRFGSKAAA